MKSGLWQTSTQNPMARVAGLTEVQTNHFHILDLEHLGVLPQ